MSDSEFIGRFERLEIPGQEFRHADHVRAAWICLQSGGFSQGAARFVASFRRYVEHLGAADKYHETVTWFYLVTINARIAAAEVLTWEEFAHANLDLLDPSMPILRKRYEPDLFESAVARRTFLLPSRGQNA